MRFILTLPVAGTVLCHVMLHESLSFVTKGGSGHRFYGLGVLPQKKFLKILKNGPCDFYAFW